VDPVEQFAVTEVLAVLGAFVISCVLAVPIYLLFLVVRTIFAKPHGGD